ncbi:MAG: hypothetical protein KF832_20335 [Caldilineaceae bacterium]|nr:hypothetical protein [Caldilineaceae bacterium]
MYVEINAWREMLARIFIGFTEQDNVSPAWLVNPATRRRLKLDKYYPEAGIAIRFIGLLAKGQGRQSDWEVLETEQRDETRVELCRQNGVQLVLIDPADDVRKQLDHLLQALTRASRVLAQSQQAMPAKQKWMPALHEARGRAVKVHSSLSKNAEQVMATLAESWRDRETGLTAELQTTPQAAPRKVPKVTYQIGQRVQHERFGIGTVTQYDDGRLSVSFDGSQERTFAAELVYDKLKVLL